MVPLASCGKTASSARLERQYLREFVLDNSVATQSGRAFGWNGFCYQIAQETDTLLGGVESVLWMDESAFTKKGTFRPAWSGSGMVSWVRCGQLPGRCVRVAVPERDGQPARRPRVSAQGVGRRTTTRIQAAADGAGGQERPVDGRIPSRPLHLAIGLALMPINTLYWYSLRSPPLVSEAAATGRPVHDLPSSSARCLTSFSSSRRAASGFG